MYTLVRTIPWHRVLRQQALPLGASLVIADLAYRFHSFALEAVAFLATWYALDAARYRLALLAKSTSTNE